MKRLLSTTTALSLAIAPVQPWPLLAQTLLDDGSVVAADGTILCQPTADAPCDLEAILTDLAAAAEAQRQADEAAAAAAAAEAQKQADEAAASAAAEAQKQADAAAAAAAAEAQRQTDEAAAAAAAEAQKQADEAAAAAAAADAQKQADEAAAAAAAEAQKQADEAAAAAAAEAQRQADEAAAAAAADAQKQADEAAAAEPAAPAEIAVVPELSAEAEAAFEAAATAEAEAEAAAEVAPADAPDAAPVDLPLVSDEALQVVTDLLTRPEDGAGAAPVAAAAETEAGAAPQGETVTTVTEADARSSFEEFSAAPTLVDGGKKKSGLSDLEKVGLLALGALVVGSVLKDGREVVSNSGDRVVVREPGGNFAVYKDDDTLLRRPGATVRTQTFSDGSTRSTVIREDGTEVVTIRDAAGRVLRRAAYDRQGFETVLIDDLAPEERIDVATLPPPRQSSLNLSTATTAEDRALRAELARIEAGRIGRNFSLRQIRDIKEVRRLAASIDVDNITFDSGSAVIRTTEARNLAALGQVMQEILDTDPAELFLIEGHTDAVGSAASNLMLSDRRAESVALALTEYFAIPPENIVVQGYGEFDLRIVTEADERANRRVAVRLISPLMRSATR